MIGLSIPKCNSTGGKPLRISIIGSKGFCYIFRIKNLLKNYGAKSHKPVDIYYHINYNMYIIGGGVK